MPRSVRGEPVSMNLKHGFNRLFLVLALGWAIFCAVFYPLQQQWEGQHQAFMQHDKDYKNCAQLLVERPEWPLTKNCYEQADIREKNRLDFYSFKNFWMLPVAIWYVFLPLIVLPPVVVYGLAVLGVWVWRGFRQRALS